MPVLLYLGKLRGLSGLFPIISKDDEMITAEMTRRGCQLEQKKGKTIRVALYD
ncbi:hypothetical protein FC75_GL000602 [Lacticaseibacillus camelliae DSM 22697 = JCM 13995]|uniref:Uncharacterized protein n=1 Tax=Lacticaseibacillus camelliae DSM 22697 = JCM 13995 TaxID=1423730 RepID=A0A0R2EXK6_9LACO|nr:hypothetical protein FC75_GL000602 [Lacticaseibacillus camelliae DSM 22697 = JCM 13995]